MSKLSDYEYSILDEIRRDEINQALRLKDLVEKRIINLGKQIEVAYQEDICDIDDYGLQFRKKELRSLLDDSIKDEEVLR
jgi:hypothetical protein